MPRLPRYNTAISGASGIFWITSRIFKAGERPIIETDERFKFESMEHAARVFGQLTRKIENHHSMTVGLQTILLALMATHHDHEQVQVQVQVQLAIMTYMEHLPAAMPEDSLSEAKREQVRFYLEGLQQGIKPMPIIRIG